MADIIACVVLGLNLMKSIVRTLTVSLFAALLVLTGCATVNHADNAELTASSLGDQIYGVMSEIPETEVGERDNLYSLLALTLVNKEWQARTETRGHNIGSVLVNNITGDVVFYARNSNKILGSSCQHGEVKLITNFLKCEGVAPYLNDYTLYTTLEPCIMCAGMLAMTHIGKVVYVQRDPGYGNTQEILSDNYRISYDEATVLSDFKKRLEQTYAAYVEYIEKKGGNAAITKWLLTERAHQIFNDAEPALRNYHVIFKENQDVLDKIYAFLEKDLSENYGENMAKQCPNKKFKINH